MIAACSSVSAAAIARAEQPVFAALGGRVARVDCETRHGVTRWWITTRGGAQVRLRVRKVNRRAPLMFEDGSGWVRAGAVTLLVSPSRRFPVSIVD